MRTNPNKPRIRVNQWFKEGDAWIRYYSGTTIRACVVYPGIDTWLLRTYTRAGFPENVLPAYSLINGLMTAMTQLALDENVELGAVAWCFGLPTDLRLGCEGERLRCLTTAMHNRLNNGQSYYDLAGDFISPTTEEGTVKTAQTIPTPEGPKTVFQMMPQAKVDPWMVTTEASYIRHYSGLSAARCIKIAHEPRGWAGAIYDPLGNKVVEVCYLKLVDAMTATMSLASLYLNVSLGRSGWAEGLTDDELEKGVWSTGDQMHASQLQLMLSQRLAYYNVVGSLVTDHLEAGVQTVPQSAEELKRCMGPQSMAVDRNPEADRPSTAAEINEFIRAHGGHATMPPNDYKEQETMPSNDYASEINLGISAPSTTPQTMAEGAEMGLLSALIEIGAKRALMQAGADPTNPIALHGAKIAIALMMKHMALPLTGDALPKREVIERRVELALKGVTATASFDATQMLLGLTEPLLNWLTQEPADLRKSIAGARDAIDNDVAEFTAKREAAKVRANEAG